MPNVGYSGYLIHLIAEEGKALEASVVALGGREVQTSKFEACSQKDTPGGR
jgi:hypothetical protein